MKDLKKFSKLQIHKYFLGIMKFQKNIFRKKNSQLKIIFLIVKMKH